MGNDSGLSQTEFCDVQPDLTTLPDSECASLDITELQQHITDKSKQYYIDNAKECRLIKDMLDVNPDKRPNCDNITSTLAGITKYERNFSKLSNASTNDSFTSSGEQVPLLANCKLGVCSVK